ncbi:MAG: hypothetical protein J7574_14430 [Flavobacterium sp.]|uniref:hypothetical protein n=1 Tax=Flavobacterium sp. TaxID=239 RepID=UPI001B1B4C72|nr:hypothetical protein [Flavobacterium sp.]MBO9585356.1 hypothetical protein [Flavobacterium sp.]
MKRKFKNIILKTKISLFLVAIISINLQAQKKAKDTLFFKVDNLYLFEDKNNSKTFLIKDSNRDEEICFEETTVIHNLKPMQVLDLKYFIRNSKFYNRYGKNELSNYSLTNFLHEYEIFLVRECEKTTDFISVNILLRSID